MADEEWRPVAGYEGLYEVSSLGRVKSLERVIPRSNGVPQRIKERVLKTPTAKISGYPQVRLYQLAAGNRGGKTHLVHRMVLEAFEGPCPEGMESLHGNDVPDDNRLENLRWGTSSENKYDIVRNGNHGMARKTHCKREHPLQGNNVLLRGISQWRVCRACKLEAGSARSSKRPFNLEKSWSRFQQLMEGTNIG